MCDCRLGQNFKNDVFFQNYVTSNRSFHVFALKKPNKNKTQSPKLVLLDVLEVARGCCVSDLHPSKQR